MSKRSIRFCKNCKKLTKFEYSYSIRHSECKECLCREARKVTEKEIEEYYKQEIRNKRKKNKGRKK